ncbi:MAG: DUF3667 domain-containing protein [Bacteroidales bacterium]|nr:MAG: DUF3667 domain-containing protein [Bacteroidales bacterium]
MTTCKNCNNQFDGKYCNNCGQSATVRSITFRFLWHDLQHGLLHVDKGFFFTIKELFTRPGHSVREYLGGKRIALFKPFSFLILIAGLYGFLYHYFDLNIVSSISNETTHSISKKINSFVSTHFSLVQLACLPCFSIATWIVFRNRNRNLAEFFVLNTYITGQRIIIQFLLLPFMIFYNGTHTLRLVVAISLVIYVVFYCWGVIQFVQERRLINGILKSILALLLFIVFTEFVYIIVILLLAAFNII